MAVRYPGALADGLTEDLVCSLEKPYEAPDLTEAERAAIRYGELLATDHLGIDDSVYLTTCAGTSARSRSSSSAATAPSASASAASERRGT